jgi:hypothetical protein
VLFHNACENTKLCNITAQVHGIITSFRSYYVHLVSFYIDTFPLVLVTSCSVQKMRDVTELMVLVLEAVIFFTVQYTVIFTFLIYYPACKQACYLLHSSS